LNRHTNEIAASLSIGVAAAMQLARRNAKQDFEAERNISKVLTLFNDQTKISTLL
jgi:hypothetical protein